MNEIIEWIKRFLTQGNVRSVKIKRNILGSFALKGASVIVSFTLVPLILNYLDPTRYGIWMTLSSIMMWLGLLDIGVGNGLRNKLAEALAQNDVRAARIYTSTTYAALVFISGIIYGVFLIANQFLNWPEILNTGPELKKELSVLMLVVFTFFAIRFVLDLISKVLLADQRIAISNSFNPISNFISLIIVFILIQTTNSSLLYCGTVLSTVPVAVLAIASMVLFARDYKHIRPSFKFIRLSYFKQIISLSVQFFILQIAVIIIFTTDNLLIAQFMGPQAVTPYVIAQKYFGIVGMSFAIIVEPFWSAYTEAYTRKDTAWIQQSTQKLLKIWLVMAALTLLLLALSTPFYRLWVGGEISVPFLLSSLMGVFVLISTWNNIFIMFINGIGKIRLQLYSSIIGAVINIPVSILFMSYFGLGSAGVILGTCISLIGSSVWAPIQYHKIIHNRATGIWAK